MSKFGIAFYTDTYLPAVDGVVSSMLNFKGELERRGHKVYIFAAGDKRAKQAYGREDVFLYTGVKFKPYPQYKFALFPYNSVTNISKLNIDLIHAQTPFAMGFAGLLTSKLTGYPIAGSFHTMVNDPVVVRAYFPKNAKLRRFTSKYLWKYTKFFYRRCDKTIAPSGTIASVLREHGINSPAVVPNSIDTGRFKPGIDGSDIRERLGIRDCERMVLYLGRVSKEKRLEVLLKAAKVLSKKNHTKFVIAGTGPSMEHYKATARRLGLGDKVIFTGFVEEEEKPKLYAACDALCLPSTFETQGIVSLEAMALGKPVVGADYLALKELIKDGENGERFRAGDFRHCASKIERVLNDSHAYKKQAIRTANGFSIGRATDKLLDVYKGVMAEKAIN